MSRKAKLSQIVPETDQISSFRLLLPGGINNRPGQWMDVTIAPGLKHTFTISLSPTEDFVQFTTMLRPQSEFKRILFALKVGSKLDIEGPHGSFVMNESDTRPRLFLAGGIGITPFRSMLKYAIDKDLQLPITLLHSVKTRSAAPFVNWLTGQLTNWQTVRVVETEVKGRLNEKKVKELVPDFISRTWWICGPAGFVDAMRELALEMGITEDLIKSEDFPGY